MDNKISRRRLFAAAFLLSAAVTPMSLSAQEPVTLVIANSQWLDALRGENLWAAVKAYEATQPDVVLEQEAIPSAQFADRIITEMGARQGPDIVIAQEGVFYSLADAGFLVDIGAATEGVDLNGTAENGVIDGVTLGVPWQRAVYALIYNKALLEEVGAEVPTDLDGLIASAQQVQTKPGAIGFTARHQISDFSGWFMDFQNWAYGYGVNWVDDEGNLTIDTPEAQDAMAAFKKLYDADVIPVGDDMPTQRNRFKQEQVGFSLDNSGGTLNIGSGGPLPSADLMAARLPFPQPGAHQQLFVSVSDHSEHKDEAIAFLSWLMSPEGQDSLRAASGPDALATDVPVDPDFVAANPWAPTFDELAKTSRSTLIPGYEVETPQIMRPVMEALEKVILAGVSPSDALAEAQQQVDGLF
ncbi:ABC transporter substrate-binding protein [Celeribacter indicus]|uniref:Extracellular solute-binding protein n=1 Tax=Celeribacter indicus TaxID=1208324 RepID=A0A0B5E5M8_9RHOB|nr:extracellular solute-binding protein [Celeribacter indicus]AJE48665.1 extracellular solute-binding protein [Celeribacter indicus]SDX35245.1 carbohydrate ABC transporter substrate-binding protein, CUT1 family [Celeribacter indicus]